MLFHPDIYFKDCEECKEFIIVDGKPHRTPDGKKIKRREGEKPNCHTCERSTVTQLTQANWYTWEMYRRHKHFGLEEFERKDSMVQKHMILLGEIDQASKLKFSQPIMGAM